MKVKVDDSLEQLAKFFTQYADTIRREGECLLFDKEIIDDSRSTPEQQVLTKLSDYLKEYPSEWLLYYYYEDEKNPDIHLQPHRRVFYLWNKANQRRLPKKFSKIKIARTCGNPICIEPTHLIICTRSGEGNSRAKLTQQDVDQIRVLRQTQKLSYRVLSKKFNVSAEQIRRILSRENW